jgi:ankyrin repeat protein
LRRYNVVMTAGADLAVKDRYGGTPLTDAVRHKHDAVTAFLKAQGGSLEAGAYTHSLLSST